MSETLPEDSHAESMKFAAALETEELAMLYTSIEKKDAASMARKDLLEWFKTQELTGDLRHQVGEIQQFTEGLKQTEPSKEDQGDKPQQGADVIVSWSAGEWVPVMSQGPDKTEEANRLKWAQALYDEQSATRERLLKFEGIHL